MVNPVYDHQHARQYILDLPFPVPNIEIMRESLNLRDIKYNIRISLRLVYIGFSQ